MSIKFWALEDKTAEEHAEHVQNLLNQGWERVFSVVDSQRECPFISYMERDTAAATVQKNGVYLASFIEVLEKRVGKLESQYQELTAGDVLDEAVPTDWLENQMELYKTVKMAGNSRFIPLGDIYAEVLAEADAEDALREGNHG